jgi:hypothetical protein
MTKQQRIGAVFRLFFSPDVEVGHFDSTVNLSLENYHRQSTAVQEQLRRGSLLSHETSTDGYMYRKFSSAIGSPRETAFAKGKEKFST